MDDGGLSFLTGATLAVLALAALLVA